MLRDVENLFEYKEEENYEKPKKVSNFWQKAIAINSLSSIYNDFEHIRIKKVFQSLLDLHLLVFLIFITHMV